jgi:Xaa-Pro aminopeptidase
MKRLLILLVIAIVSIPALAFERQSNAEYRARRERLAAKLGDATVVLFAATEAEGQNALHGFRQDDDFYYLTGSREPGAAVVVSGKPYREILFLPAHNVSQEKWTGPKLGPENANAKSITGFDKVDVLDHLRDTLVEILPTPTATVYTGDTSSVALTWLRRTNAFPNYASVKDSHALIAELRVIKDAGEIALIRKATDASVEAHRAAMRATKPNVGENEISALMQYEFQRRGCEQPAYSPIVGSGFNSTVLHYSADENVMKGGDLVVMDVGGEYSMYATDITRTLPVSGHFTPRQREIYGIVLGAQKAAVDAFKSGTSTFARTSPNSIYKVAMDYINAHGKDSDGNTLGRYFIHGLSHYVGLGVHDPGDTSKPLMPGMVFTIEPGIYIPQESLGVRIEDTYLVKDDGTLDCLSCALVKTADDIERAMNAKR